MLRFATREQGVGISNKSVTPLIRYKRGVNPQSESQPQTSSNAPKHRRVSRYVKLAIVITVLLGVSGSQLIGKVSSKPRYVAPQARLENPISATTAQPVDEIVAAEVAAAAAQEADLLVTPNVANRADTLGAQVDTQAKTEDSADTVVVEKPQLVVLAGSSVAQIQTITAQQGDTVPSIAAKYNISPNTVRWANDLATDALVPGTKLIILPVSGVLYTVASGDTAESIASTYRANKDAIIAFNDVELKGLKPGSQIIIPGGIKPSARSTADEVGDSYSSSASFAFGGSSTLYAGNRYAYGYCTYYAYNKRSSIGRPVGSNWGNATSWASYARAAGFGVDKNPRAGDVFQTSGGWGGYGHVGFVEQVNSDGSILVSEMNYAGWNVISSRTIPADQVSVYWFIH